MRWAFVPCVLHGFVLLYCDCVSLGVYNLHHPIFPPRPSGHHCCQLPPINSNWTSSVILLVLSSLRTVVVYLFLIANLSSAILMRDHAS